MFEDVKVRITTVIGPTLRSLDLDIFGFSIKRNGRVAAVRLFIDHENGGVNIDECTAVNKEISRLIEEEGLIEGDYTVEVSSPGMDWPLRTQRDFNRAKGYCVKFHLKEKVGNKLEHDGVINEVKEDHIVVEIKESVLKIPFTVIQKAVQIIN